LTSKTSVGTFAVALVSYLRKNYTGAAPRNDKRSGNTAAPLVSLDNLAVSLQLLQTTVGPTVLNQSVAGLNDRTMNFGSTLGENAKSLLEACVVAFPSLRSSFAVAAPPSSALPATLQQQNVTDDVEEMATAYFQKIYTSEQSIGEVVEMLKRFKTSGNSKENEIFACMVHNLFDEYRFFSKYPEKELRISGILFGALIQEQLVSSITLGIALRYVLEALRKPPSPPGAATTSSSGKMFKFGMFALEQFKGRLHEWPQYCSHIVHIPHLKDGYADLVSEIEQEMSKSQARAAATGQPQEPGRGSQATSPLPPSAAPEVYSPPRPTSTSQLEAPPPAPPPPPPPPVSNEPPRVAEFGPKLGRAVTDRIDDENEFEAPTDVILDKVQFLVNNLAPSNVESKAQELKDMLEPKYFGWLGHFLVVKRISTQANFHSLYLSFLDCLGEYGKGLVEAILSSVYHNIGKLLRSPKITTSSSERSYLKNLGIWLGQITLAKNRPILQIMLDCKELLLQGYETGKLIAVAPFLAKTMEGAKNSVIFRPPNPWLMGILGVFRSVYDVEGLKMNIKFEVEVLCKNLGIKLEDIPLRCDILSKRVTPVKERNLDFNIKTAPKPVSTAPSRGMTSPDVVQPLGLPNVGNGPSGEAPTRSASSGSEDATMIPNLAAYVTVNPSLPQLLQSQGGVALSSLTTSSLKRWVPIAVDRAIREIIQPVVERSVTIACITTKEVVTKDFAMESDETKMRNAGQLMVAKLAGSLALVTCREPLRASVSTHLRQLLTNNLGRTEKLGEQEQNAIEQCVQICATDNLELGCMLIQKAATEKAVREVDDALSAAINARRNHREQTGQPYYDMSIFSNGNRYPAALPDQLRPKPSGLKAEHFQLYESFSRMPRQSQASSSAQGASAGLVGPRASSSSAGPGEVDAELQLKQGSSQQFGSDTLNSLASKLDSAISALLSVAGSRASEIKLAMLPPDHQIRQLLGAIKAVMPNASPSGGASRSLTTSEHEVVLSFSQGIFKRLYELSLSETLRLEALVALLEGINIYCPKLGKDMGTWATYAPTNTEQQRKLHRTVLLLLVRSRLLSVHDLDVFLAARADQGRNHIWVEFSLLFIRTACLERISNASDFPKLMDLMAKIVDGRSRASPQIVQTYRKSILRMLEETRGPVGATKQRTGELGPISVEASKEFVLQENSSLSLASLSAFVGAPKKVAEATDSFTRNDPPNSRQQITALLDSWIRLQSETSVSEKTVGQYLQVLQQYGVGKSEEATERFLRLSMLIVVDAVMSSSPTSDGQRSLNYTFIDLYSKLLVLLFRHMNSGGTADRVDAQRLGVLNKILGVGVRSMMWHFKKSESSDKSAWDQRPWYRLFMNLVIDLNKPEPSLESIRLGVLSVFGATFHVCQPLALPGFSFAWLELISHRHFLPNIMLFPGQKAWHIMHQLLVDNLLFLEPYLRRSQLPPPVKSMYEGTLRVILLLLHDFPSFLAGYHLSLCNCIPESCVQLRNIILSANPKGMSPPDPFTPNLKIDLLPEISQSPVVLSNVLGPIESFRSHLDAFLKDGQRRNFLSGLLPLLYKEGTTEVDASKAGSLILYVGAHARARPQSSQISLSRTPEMEVIQKLMELEDHGRYTVLNAIANQLRYPSSHTHYFSCVMLFLFSESKSVAVKEQVTRVLLERLIVYRPHPWGLLVTFIELIKNQRYGFWNYPFTRCATEIEKVFESVARSCLPPGAPRFALVGGGEEE
jgi:CCR4-NOT transcription complex subunit 1